MSRLMSVALTEQAVRERRKTVTRRLGWASLTPGTRLTLCRKVMGRKRSDGTVEPLVRLAEVEVVSVRREKLWDITDEDVVREGVDPALFEEHYVDTGHPTPQAWVAWFCEQMNVQPDDVVTRICWRYLDGDGSMTAPHPMVTIRQHTPCVDCGDDMWPGERAYPVEGGIRCLVCHAKRIPVAAEFVEAVESRLGIEDGENHG